MAAVREEEPSEGILEPGPQPITDPAKGELAYLAESTVESIANALPKVSILGERTPADLSPAPVL